MKKIIIPIIIVAGVAGTFFLANKTYNEKISESMRSISISLEKKGYEVEYKLNNNSILDNYIVVNDIKLSKNNDVIDLNELKFNVDAFKMGSEQKPDLFEVYLKELSFSDSFNYKGSFDTYYIYDYNETNKTFNSRFEIKNDEFMNTAIDLKLEKADKAWNCFSNNTITCDLGFDNETLEQSIGSIKVDKLDISFVNKGIIESRLKPIYQEDGKIDELKSFLTEVITLSNISDNNKSELNKFIKKFDNLDIKLKQKSDEDLKSIVLNIITELKNNDVKKQEDFVQVILSHLSVEFKNK